MSWSPPIALLKDEGHFKVGATDAEDAEVGKSCELRLALKVRPKTTPQTHGWLRRWDPFILDPFRDAIRMIHSKITRGMDQAAAIGELQAAAFSGLHPGVQHFFCHALDAYFDYHNSRVEQVGALRLIPAPNLAKSSKAILTAWGLLYEADNGDREFRRLRFSEPRNDKTSWAYVAAHLAAETPGLKSGARIWITEVGLLKGIERHILDGVTRAEASELYEKHARANVLAATRGVKARPGRNCSGCGITGACAELHTMTGFAQTATQGGWTSSLSASDLEKYDRCPSQWYMENVAHLPREIEGHEAQARGLLVHEWLASAHARGVPCSADDIPDPQVAMPVVMGDSLDRSLYATIYPFLIAHLPYCPLQREHLTPLSTQRTLYGFDRSSDLVIATNSDLLFIDDDVLIVREVKTTQDRVDSDSDGIRDRYLAVAWNLVALDTALVKHFRAAVGEVQLEVLTPSGGHLFKYRTDDVLLMKMARGRIRRLTEVWRPDVAWKPKPNAGCPTCSVRRWCPSRDEWAKQPRAESEAGGSPT